MLESTRMPRARTAVGERVLQVGGSALRRLVGDQLDADEAALDADVADLLVAIHQRDEHFDGHVVEGT